MNHASQRGWSINLGGGMHHAWRSNGMGWCPFDDLYLAIMRLRRASGGAIRKVMVVDLDAHQVRMGFECGCSSLQIQLVVCSMVGVDWIDYAGHSGLYVILQSLAGLVD